MLTVLFAGGLWPNRSLLHVLDVPLARLRDARVSLTLVEVGEARTEHVLLAVAAGAGIALLPESAAERHVVPGVRFVVVDHAEPAFESAVLTLHGSNDTLATSPYVRIQLLFNHHSTFAKGVLSGRLP